MNAFLLLVLDPPSITRTLVLVLISAYKVTALPRPRRCCWALVQVRHDGNRTKINLMTSFEMKKLAFGVCPRQWIYLTSFWINIPPPSSSKLLPSSSTAPLITSLEQVEELDLPSSSLLGASQVLHNSSYIYDLKISQWSQVPFFWGTKYQKQNVPISPPRPLS